MRLGRTGPEPATCGRLGRRLHAMVAVLVLKGVELKMIELKQVHCQGPVRILLVDDQPACLASLGSVLTCNGYIVDTAVEAIIADVTSNGRTGMQQANQEVRSARFAGRS
jgi:PleD family two-component response regulator